MISKRLKLLLRKNEGRLILKKRIPQLNRILNRFINSEDFIGLEQSDIILKSYDKILYEKETIQNFPRYCFASDKEAIQLISLFKEKNRELDLKGYVFFKDSDMTGGLILSFKEFCDHALELVKLDRDIAYFVTPDLNYSLYLTLDEDTTKPIEIVYFEENLDNSVGSYQVISA